MSSDSLPTFIRAVNSAWGPLSTELVAEVRDQLRQLLKAPDSDDWLAALHRVRPLNEELYRDAEHGFVLLAHTETQGLYRPPHDHGRGWVIYAVQNGEIEMDAYVRVTDADGSVRLVKRDSLRVRAGQVQVYLPGDIHDTRCISSTALLYRFTERDLRVEDREAHQLTRYHQSNGVWTIGSE